MRNNVLIIVGMHRSGTSATSQWLQECGLNIGNHLLEKNDFNKNGHFEDLDFHDLHEKILKAKGFSYGGLLDIEDFTLDEYEKAQLKTLVEEKDLASTKDWGWKEPRTCLFLKDYTEIIPQAKLIVILRDYRNIIQSLTLRKLRKRDVKYDKKNLFIKFLYTHIYKKILIQSYVKKYTKATTIYYKNILAVVNENNSLVFDFERICDLDDEIIDTINQWGFKLEKYPAKLVINPTFITPVKIKIKPNKELDELQNNIKLNTRFITTA